MEPLDLGRNDENSGFSKRRISSILKAPRKSIKFSDTEQQENQVESAKPVEKRISRRVSFAPANDVLLFPKDGKNASSGRSPLQELMSTSTPTQNRLQVSSEDGIQQITGMETLLSAPLRASDQNEKVISDTDFGEKTVMYCADDGIMDMTQSHTINIDVDYLVDTPQKNSFNVFQSGETTVMPSADCNGHNVNMARGLDFPFSGRNTDFNLPVSSFDPTSTIFPASLSKPTGLNVDTNLSQTKTQKFNVDIKNQVPSSVKNTGNVRESFRGSALSQDDDVVDTCRVTGLTDDNDDPFQCLFPSQEMYSQSDKGSQESQNQENPQKHAIMTPGSFTPKAPEHRFLRGDAEEHTEKTVMFPADDAYVHMTQSHPVKNTTDQSAAPIYDNVRKTVTSVEKRHKDTLGRSSSANNLDSGVFASLLKPKDTSLNSGYSGMANTVVTKTPSNGDPVCPEDDLSMDMTEVQTGHIEIRGSNDPLHSFRPAQEIHPQGGQTSSQQFCTEKQRSSYNTGKETSLKASFQHQMTCDSQEDCRQKTMRFTDDSVLMDVTRSHTVNIDCVLPMQSHKNAVNLLPKEERTVRFSADDCAMDVTQSHTTKMTTLVDPGQHHKVDIVPAGGEKTLRFTADDADMDVTRSHTVNIDSHFEPHIKTNVDILPVGGERTRWFSADDATMDVTRSHTVNIDTHFEPMARNLSEDKWYRKWMDIESRTKQNVDALPIGGEKTLRFSADDAAMDVTRSHTVNIDTQIEPRTKQKVNALPIGGEKTIRFSADDAAMDVTRSHTVNIDTHIERRPKQNVDVLPIGGEKTMRFSADDAAMDVTRSHTVNIDTHFEPRTKRNVDVLPTGGEKTLRFSADDAAMDVTRSHTVNIDTHIERRTKQNVDVLPIGGEKTLRFSSDDAAMDVTRSHTVNIDTHIERRTKQNVDVLPIGGEKTLRFFADDAAMDVTRSHTVNIDTHIERRTKQNVDVLPIGGEKTLRFFADDAAMDVTRSHTVNIDTHFEPRTKQNVDVLPIRGEKTLRFSADDAAMDVTRSHTVNIDTHIERRTKQNVDVLLIGGEKTLRFSADDAAMDVTQSHTVNIDSHIERRTKQKLDTLLIGGEKTLQLTADDAAMDVTRSRTVAIDTRKPGAQNVVCVPVGGEKTIMFSAGDAAMNETSHTVNTDTPFEPHTITNVAILPVGGEKTLRFSADDTTKDMQRRHTVSISGNSILNEDPPIKKREKMTSLSRNRSLSVLSFDTGFKTNDSCLANPMITREEPPAEPSFPETSDLDHFIPALPKTPCMDNATKVQALVDNDVNEIPNMAASLQGAAADVGMNMTELQTGLIVVEKCSDEPSQSSTQDPYAGLQEARKATSPQSNQESGPSKHDGMEISNVPDHVDSKETKIRKDDESPIANDHDSPSRKSRRISLADLHKKVRRLSCLVNPTPETPAVDSCKSPTPHLDPGVDNTKNDLLPAAVPDVETDLGNTKGEAPYPPQEYATVETPFKLKTKELMSRLSVGGFKAKLPQKNRADDPKKANSSHMNSERKSASRTTTNNTANNLGNWNDDDVSDIYDEELDSCEDLSETLDDRSAPKIPENAIPFEGFNIDESLLDVFEEDSANCAPAIKRRLPSDESNTEEKKMKKSNLMVSEAVETGIHPHILQYDGNIITAPTTIHTMDSSSSTHTSSSRSDSTLKRSMLESQLEDYSTDKFEDGTITVSEFLKLFNIDFVIHKPRQSMLPGRSSFDTDCTPMDVVKDKLINRPKQLVYEADIKSLSEKVEGLNYRMRDLDKPLKMVNQALWEEMKNSSENELKCFGVKLKERNNYFRKMSKVRSHEMKEVLYTGVVQAITAEQQKLKVKVDESEGMIRMLDDCISDLEAELAAIEVKGTDSKPSLKTLQEELQKVNDTLNDNERQICELEMQKKQTSSKLDYLKADVANLEGSIAIFNMLNEWRLKEKTDQYAVYTFLSDTLHLQLMYKGNGAAEDPEHEISHITFTFLLDDTRSQCHARLVHKLLSQHIDSQTAWVEKYPTSSRVQELLSDVSLVVSHCRLLGEEIRLLKMWGGLRLNIVDIRCVDTRVHILFSSLRTCAKFEVTFSVSLDTHIYSLQVHSFNAIIGNTTIQQIESIIESFIPAKKLLTNVIKKINTDLL
uniref:kinetochore scaffold 1 isoform X2 n=1 Tax=Doryrhamphus excisus TaxID=161450 RepID=UPI0025AEB289|nr:kinetochore scaffold 1 isoform X2 [Doryrhamphus excisus]